VGVSQSTDRASALLRLTDIRAEREVSKLLSASPASDRPIVRLRRTKAGDRNRRPRSLAFWASRH